MPVDYRDREAAATARENAALRVAPPENLYTDVYDAGAAVAWFGEPVAACWLAITITQDSDAELEARFHALADRWHEATDVLSSPSRITSHPAYLEIVGMGATAIPLILRDLQQRGGAWYPALRAITGASPVPRDVRGDVQRMTAAWLQWGRERQYIG